MKNLSISVVTSLVMLAAGGANAADHAAYPITAEAAAKLEKAIADAQQAETLRNPWTSTKVALDEAKRAAAKGDSVAVIRYANTASEQAQLSIGQTNYSVVQ